VNKQTASPPSYLRVADELRRRIVLGELMPGQQLPTEPELPGQVGVSRSTWREAIRRLEAEGLITTVRGVTGGTFVAEPSPADVAAYMQTALTLLSRTQLTTDQMAEARRLLEIPAAGFAASRRGDADLAKMAESVDRARDLHGPEQWAENHRFHNLLLEAAGNPLVAALSAPIESVLGSRIDRESPSEGFWAQVCDDHQDVFCAVRDGDSEAARDAMARHLDNLAKAYLTVRPDCY
jgi:GntR family transcriptional repressor for pyruvate dehydrogenase complex